MHKIKKLIPQSVKNVYHLSIAVLANLIFGFPTKKIKVIGITGTDGKTTTVQMVTKTLEEAGKKVAMASTINFQIGNEKWTNLSHYTTESSFAVQKFAAKAVKNGCDYLILETSSHALDQHRVWGINYDIAVITNVTREHLDYHKTIENYRKAKKKLFEMVSKNKGTIIVNLEMENPNEFLYFEGVNKYGYSTKISNNKLQASDLEIVSAQGMELGIDNSRFVTKNTQFELNLPGLFNVENALAAICVGITENIDLEIINNALRKLKGVPGRMEHIANEKGLDIIVDFALTPESLEKFYSFIFTVKKSGAKIISVFGSCGDRDKGKRPIMGKVVSEYADYIILTNDEPYFENPDKIIQEIEVGIKNKKENETYWKMPDRREAIKKALKLSKRGDIIAITGMGAEESMVVAGKKIPWNDRKVVEEELKNLS
ncbi:MAG: UDP-N-acetylmuramoylalanyl-D-glutamate-2, 6-diaminopimelate ligase [uncultured bacterium]|nr:MAG: UDP-N-acetylmuramoylalanyl-D-glutamate-2, 6-diaminopimelate ligase [uncultured bacterium]